MTDRTDLDDHSPGSLVVSPGPTGDAVTEPLEPPPADLVGFDDHDREVGVVRRWGVPIVVTAIILVAVELFIRYGPLKQSSLPPPSTVAHRLIQIVPHARFWASVGHTLQGWAGGLGLAVLLGVPAGLLLGTSRWLYQSCKLVLDFIRPIPSIALLPLFILIFGINLHLKIYITALGAFFPILFQTMYGVQDVDPVARDTARSYHFNWAMRFVFVDLLGAMQYIMTGLRLSASVALVVSVAAELLIGVQGMGQQVFIAQNADDVNTMYAYIAATGIVGLAIAGLFFQLERMTLRWHPSQRGEPGR